MLNTLANHGFLPHDGKDISKERTIEALGTALNIGEELAVYLFQEAMTTNPDTNAITVNLNHLSRHNILEHDASLSRQDAYFGDNHNFNQTVFDKTRSYWPDSIIDLEAAALSREARVNTSRATNPNYNMSQLGEDFSYGETAAYLIVLGDKESGTVDRSWVEYMFEKERLPTELGWTKRNKTITLEDLSSMLQQIVKVTSATSEERGEIVRRGSMHTGRGRTVKGLERQS
ncbi:peroxidase family protein [Aspergillus undulatus]|uniref:peroxidase family protein n=1 Tax=Aspergillus undulatus TaxID=1810928 RepID=UPI003CCD896C